MPTRFWINIKKKKQNSVSVAKKTDTDTTQVPRAVVLLGPEQ